MSRIACETDGCDWAVHAEIGTAALDAYARHLSTDPRHRNGEWIDRDGRERRGLEVLPE